MKTTRPRGRAVLSQPPAAQGRPAAWGAWEWRDHTASHEFQRANAAPYGIHVPPGLKRACLNQVYSVMFFEVVTPWGFVDHLMIRRHDGDTLVTWVDKQRIKDELVGTERTAVEVYPARGDLVDGANLYHLWVLPAGFILPQTLSGVETAPRDALIPLEPDDVIGSLAQRLADVFDAAERVGYSPDEMRAAVELALSRAGR